MHWFTSPYVHNLTYNSKTGLTEVETLTLFARHQRRTFSEGEVQSPQTMKPQATFQVTIGCLPAHMLQACSSCASSNSFTLQLDASALQVHGQVYYLDADNFENKELLAKLTPKEPEVAPQEQ